MQTLSVNGIKLAYNNYGQGEPLLFIHGIYCSSRQWLLQIDHFKATHQVITCDLRGHGQSSASEQPYSVKLFADDVVALLDEMGLERVPICGHSFGGLVAQELALSYPERVKGLILAETMYGLNSTPWDALMGTITSLWLPQMINPKTYMKMISDFFGMYTPGGSSYIHQELQRHLDDEDNQQNILKASLRFDSRWRLHRISCPTLLLVGQYLHIPTILCQNWQMYWRINQAKLTVIPRAGHLLHWDNPTAFNDSIHAFLAQI